MGKHVIKPDLTSITELKLLILIIITLVFNSCIQLRYTDYGKPLDFLKAKNQYHASHKQKNDTASVFVVNTISLDTHKKLVFSPKDVLEKEIFLENPLKEIDSIQIEIISEESDLSVNQDQKKEIILIDSNNTPPNSVIKHDHKIVLNKNETLNWPGDWWEKFWKGIWNFILKWLLIFLAVFVILALIIWGIYLLIALLAGQVAASIFLAIVLILFWILMNTN